MGVSEKGGKKVREGGRMGGREGERLDWGPND